MRPAADQCRFDVRARRRIIGFLQQPALSVFSEAVRGRNNYPGD